MAEEKHTETSPETVPAPAEEVVVAEVPEPPTEKEVLKEQQPPPQTEKEHKRSNLETALAAEKAEEEEEKKAATALKAAASFKEESNFVGDLQDRERKALDELKQLVQAAIASNEFSPPPPSASAPADASTENSNAEAAPKLPAEDAKAEEAAGETMVEEALKTPAEETTAAAEEFRPEEEASKPTADGAEPEEEASKPAAEEAEMDVSKQAAEEAEVEEDASKAAEEETKVEEGVFKPATEETKAEEEPPKPTAEEPVPPSMDAADATPSPAPVEAEAKSVVADDDGAKTVEAIEETVVPVAAAAPPPAEEVPPAEKEREEKPSSEAPAASAEPPEEVFIWGAPLLGDERSDTILLKFLRARDFKVKEAMAMLKNAVLWRKEFGIEALLPEDLGVPELDKVVFMHGTDREGHPVCYNVYGELQSKELHALAFADEEKRKRFLRWRIQFLERGIRDLLDLSPGGVSSMVQVIDLKNSIGLAKKELRQALDLLQDNYPEFAAKQIFINVPWWYLAFNRMISPFFTQRTKSKFVFAGPSRSAETLFKYVAPEQVPVQYGGLSKENDSKFTIADAVTEITIKASMKQSIEIPVSEACLPVWELRVLGWDVTVGVEFVPRAEDGYTIIVQKARKLSPSDEPVMNGSYKVGEVGRVILTVDNTASKKKKLLLYRYKIKASTESV